MRCLNTGQVCDLVLCTGVFAPLQTLNSLMALKRFSLVQQFCLEKGVIKHQPSKVSSPMLIFKTASHQLLFCICM